MINGLFLYRALLCSLSTQSTLCNFLHSHSHTHSYTDKNIRQQLAQYLAQGTVCMQSGTARDQTTKLLIIRWPARPSEHVKKQTNKQWIFHDGVFLSSIISAFQILFFNFLFHNIRFVDQIRIYKSNKWTSHKSYSTFV